MSHKQIKVEDMILKWSDLLLFIQLIYAMFVASWSNLVKNLAENIHRYDIKMYLRLENDGIGYKCIVFK